MGLRRLELVWALVALALVENSGATVPERAAGHTPRGSPGSPIVRTSSRQLEWRLETVMKYERGVSEGWPARRPTPPSARPAARRVL